MGLFVDKPHEFAHRDEPSRRQLPIARQDPREGLALVGAGHEKRSVPAAFKNRIGQADPHLRLGADNFGNPAPPLLEHLGAGEERGGVAIGAEPQQLDVE